MFDGNEGGFSRREFVRASMSAAALAALPASMLAAAASLLGDLHIGPVTQILIPAVITVIVVTSPWWWRSRNRNTQPDLPTLLS